MATALSMATYNDAGEGRRVANCEASESLTTKALEVLDRLESTVATVPPVERNSAAESRRVFAKSEDAWLEALYQEADVLSLTHPSEGNVGWRFAGEDLPQLGVGLQDAEPSSSAEFCEIFCSSGQALAGKSMNEAREALARIAALGMRAEEIVMAKKGNIPPMSAAYLALRERSARRKEVAMLKEVERILLEQAAGRAKMMHEGRKVIEAHKAQLRKVMAAIPAFRAAALSWQATAKRLDNQIKAADSRTHVLQEQVKATEEQLKAREHEREQALSESASHRQRAEALSEQLDGSLARCQALSKELLEGKTAAAGKG